MKYQVSFPAKISYLHTWRDHRCYGYIINCAFESKLIWYFTDVYIINRILHTCLWIWILPSCVQLDISRVSAVDHSKIKFISMRRHVISSISSMLSSPPYVSVIESVQRPFFKPWKKKQNKRERVSLPWTPGNSLVSHEGSYLSIHSLWLQNETKVLKHKHYPYDKRSYRSLQPMEEGV